MQCKCKKKSLGCIEMCLCARCKTLTVGKDLEYPFVHNDDGKDNGIQNQMSN